MESGHPSAGSGGRSRVRAGRWIVGPRHRHRLGRARSVAAHQRIRGHGGRHRCVRPDASGGARWDGIAVDPGGRPCPSRAGWRMDGALLAYVLFHLSDPAVAVADAARALRSGGRLGTVTWAHEAALGAYSVWDEVLSEAGAPPLTSRRRDVGLDSIDGIDALLSGAGLMAKRIWIEALHYQWEPAIYRQLAVGSGVNRLARAARPRAPRRGRGARQ